MDKFGDNNFDRYLDGKNPQTEEDPFYKGYDGNNPDLPDSGFKVGDAPDDGYYHGYDPDDPMGEDNFSHSNPLAAAAVMEYMTGSYRNAHHYESYSGSAHVRGALARGQIKAASIERSVSDIDSFAETISYPEEFIDLYPDVRKAVVRDVLHTFIIMTVAALIIILMAFKVHNDNTEFAKKSQGWLDSADVYQGTVVSIAKNNNKYRLLINYEADGELQSDTIEVSEKYVKDNKLESAQESTVDVYVNSYDHNRKTYYARLEAESVSYVSEIVMAFAGVVLIILAFIMIWEVHSGRIITFTTIGKNAAYVRRYKRISKFKSHDPSIWDRKTEENQCSER